MPCKQFIYLTNAFGRLKEEENDHLEDIIKK